MPTVARPDRQVAPARLPAVRKSAAETDLSTGAGLKRAEAQTGDALTGLGGTLARVGIDAYARIKDDERARADSTAALKWSNAFSAWKNQRLYDPQKGAFSLKGEDTFELPEQLQSEFEAFAGDLSTQVKTPEQSLAFQKLRSQEWQSIDLQVRRHVFEETRAYDDQQFKAATVNGVQDAIRQYADPEGAERSLAQLEAKITGRPGVDPATKEQQLRAVRSETRVGIINNLLADEQATSAKHYFAQFEQQIDPERRDDVKKAIETGALRGRAQKASDEILKAGGTLTEQREKARQIADPEERDQVMQYLEHENAVRKNAEAEAERDTLDQAFATIGKRGRVTDIPPAQWEALGAHQPALRSYARSILEGVPIKTDQRTFYALMTEAGDSPETFVKRNLLADRARLSDGDFQQLSGLQLSIKTGKRSAEGEAALTGFQTKTDILNNTLGQYGIDPAAKPLTAQGQAVSNLGRALDRKIDAFQAPDPDNGGKRKRATNSDIQLMMDEILAEQASIPNSWWHAGITGQLTRSKRLVEVTINEIPEATKRQIRDALRSQRLPESDAMVLDFYIGNHLYQRAK